MQAKELCNISISPLVIAPFSTQWSTDNHMSLITERGVHVFELMPAPTSQYPNVNFARSFVNPSEILPAQKFEEEVDSILWNLEKRELYLLLMEEALTPTINGAKDLEPKITSLAWSPWCLMNPNKCLLATVTSAGAIDILFEVSRNWYSACDLSKVWFNEICKESEDTEAKLKKASPAELRKYLRGLQATAITWSELYKSEKNYFAYLVTAYRNSEIAVWCVPAISCTTWELKPSIVFKTSVSCKTKINTMKWVSLDKKVLIILGYFDGNVDGIIIDFVDDNLGNHKMTKYWANTDHIPVNCINIWKTAEHGTQVVICKGFFLCTFRLLSDGTVQDIEVVQVPGFSITGLVELSSSQLMITTQDGGLFTIGFQNKQLVYNNVTHSLPCSNVQYLGLVCSLNKCLFFNITSPNVMHDHLISREPSTVCIFKIEGSKWNPIQLLRNNNTNSLTKHWDCLEMIRVQALRSQDLDDILPTIPDNLDKLSNYELRLAMCTSAIAETLEKKKVPRKSTSISEEVSDARPLIFLRLASDRLVELGSRKELSDKQRLSASLLRSYIEVYLAGEEEEESETPSVREAKKALSLTSHLSSVEPEACDICGEIITELSWKTTSCPSGHKLPRCAVTLLQISMVNYRTCPICKHVLHPCLDEEYNEPLCPCCEIPALYDSRVLDTKRKSKLPVRNLSKRQVSTSQQTKSQGADLQDENKEEF
ncbi:uncharacterized protein LOC105690074 [Athalia rosae]|uniref:uncharacterized protein LOC105690074 n=1 Tax=Athalia rosae TaxID=37344 RepID=UPI002033DFA5|nr:uncharacterized protein LOC105690074 [Athalia rosae]